MPKVVSSQEFEQIVDLINQYPNGIGIEDLAQALGDTFKHRTLQRRLSLLLKQQKIDSYGEGRALKYRVITSASDVSTTVTGMTVAAALGNISTENYVPTSSEGEEIKAYIRQPRQKRQPVSYQVDFLGQYHPNQTYYLPSSLRDQLHSLGRSPAEQTPAGTFARDILNRLLIDLSWASSRLEGNTYWKCRPLRLASTGICCLAGKKFHTRPYRWGYQMNSTSHYPPHFPSNPLERIIVSNDQKSLYRFIDYWICKVVRMQKYPCNLSTDWMNYKDDR